MLDWMKKLFKKEEENEATALREIETPAEKKVTSQIPRVNYYSHKREDELQASKPYSGGNFRFPLIPDSRFDESTQESSHREKPAIQESPIRERRRSRRVEEVQETYIEPSTEKVRPTSKVESNRRPFRPTEMVSPIFGYNRPEARQKENEESKQQQREDIEISMEGKSVVDAWLEKNGYISSDVPQDGLTEVEPAEMEESVEEVLAETTEEPAMNEATLGAEEPAEMEESVEEVLAEATEEPVMEEATLGAEEPAEMEESAEEVLAEATEEPVMEEATLEAEEPAEMEE
ncbi:TPA: hypothetical protein ROX98_004535, partial [Bacillus pseudomycoides]|nr:hypothetical protein [Bacillus pseudomycoides]